MGRNGINYKDVADAAIKVSASNAIPTVDRIREILGTGSKSTIARYLRDWKANNGPVLNANDLPAELITLITGLWQSLQSSAEQEILAYKQETDLKVNELDHQLVKTQKTNTEQQEQIHELKIAIQQEMEKNKALNENLINDRMEASKQQERAHSLEKSLNEHKDENKKLHMLLNNIQNNLEHYQSSMQKLQQEQSLTAERQKSQFDQELSALRSQLFASNNDSNNLKLQIERLQHQVSKYENVELCNKSLEKTLKEKEKQLNILEAKYVTILKQNETTNQNLDLTIKQLIEAEQKTAVAVSRFSDLEQALQEASDKIIALHHEHLILLMN